ncbi:thioredoxin family protein [Polaribacter sargassicola]|uniref:thioredoxin family protein n=1 Tax=Polaribacter sargassicola TaxID=2836891 RepID=UPI001F466BD3|nr:thioredoxin fold domain-containing protein [Polaribacter sp. DS7-9]MCG1035367.1 thioredoxin family protein [Polaribacter sp. DS7-9]
MREYIAFITLFICLTTQSQEKKEELKIYSFLEIEKLNKQSPKPIVVFIYTDWCKYCFAMKKNTFSNKDVIKALNNKFYFVLLNAESKKDINFLNHTFKYKPTGNNTGVHQLADELAGVKNRIIYPTTTILNSNFEIDLQKSGYLNSKRMLSILKRI